MNDKQSTYDSMMQRVSEYDDEDAFKYIFDDLYAPLCLYARRMVPPGVAEDIAQEVFVALWENRNDIIIETSLKGWLLTGTRNRCLNYIKRQAVRDRYNSYAAANIDISVRPDDLLGVSELELRLEQTLANMREEWRVAFVMSQIKHAKTAEIAQHLGVSERSVERFRKKAMEIIEREMKDFAPLIITLASITQ